MVMTGAQSSRLYPPSIRMRTFGTVRQAICEEGQSL